MELASNTEKFLLVAGDITLHPAVLGQFIYFRIEGLKVGRVAINTLQSLPEDIDVMYEIDTLSPVNLLMALDVPRNMIRAEKYYLIPRRWPIPWVTRIR